MSDTTDRTKTSDAELFVSAQTLVQILDLLDELKQDRRHRDAAEEKRRLEWDEADRDLEQRIKEVQGACDLERRILCGSALPEPGTKAFQVGDKAVVVTRPLSETAGTLKIVPLVFGALRGPQNPQPREGGQS